MIRAEILSLSISADLSLSPTASQSPVSDGFVMIILSNTFSRIFCYISNSAILSSFQWPQENRIICAFSNYWLAPSSKSTAHYSYAILVLNWVLNIYINITFQSYTIAFGWSRIWLLPPVPLTCVWFTVCFWFNVFRLFVGAGYLILLRITNCSKLRFMTQLTRTHLSMV